MAAGTRRTDELKVAILGGTGAIGSYSIVNEGCLQKSLIFFQLFV